MSANPPPPKTLFGFQFITLAHRWRKLVHAALAAAELTDATWAPLVHLDASGDGISQTELAERLAIDGSTLVRLLDLLEKRAFIERRVDPKDRRARLIHLTPAGQAEVTRIKYHIIEVEKDLLADLDDSTVARLIDTFAAISGKVETALKAERR